MTAQHILLGLIAEDASKEGYMGTTVTLDAARAVVEELSSKRKKRDVKDLPFSRDSKRVFEAALTVRLAEESLLHAASVHPSL